jgi:hypothetical protein
MLHGRIWVVESCAVFREKTEVSRTTSGAGALHELAADLVSLALLSFREALDSGLDSGLVAQLRRGPGREARAALS